MGSMVARMLSKHNHKSHDKNKRVKRVFPMGSRSISDAIVIHPAHWSHCKEPPPFRRVVDCEVDAPADLAEIQLLMDSQDPMESKKRTHRLQVYRVLRIEDSQLFALYEKCTAWIMQRRSAENLRCMADDQGEKSEPPATFTACSGSFRARLRDAANEAYLWHGTSRRAAESIALHDFRIRRESKNGQKLGKGAYFAESAALADEYTSVDDQGLRTMLLVRVSLGKVKVTTQRNSAWSNKVQRVISTGQLVQSGAYDSVLGDRRKVVGTHREFCVADPHQLYPEYLVLYVKKSIRATSKERTSSKRSSSKEGPASRTVSKDSAPGAATDRNSLQEHDAK